MSPVWSSLGATGDRSRCRRVGCRRARTANRRRHHGHDAQCPVDANAVIPRRQAMHSPVASHIVQYRDRPVLPSRTPVLTAWTSIASTCLTRVHLRFSVARLEGRRWRRSTPRGARHCCQSDTTPHWTWSRRAASMARTTPRA